MGHNARKLTQVNKQHKDSSKPKGNAKKATKVLGHFNKKKVADLSKELRVLKAQQRRQNSIKLNSESDYFKRGNNTSAPLLCGIFPLFEFKDIDVIYSLLKSTDQDAVIRKVENVENYTKLNCENFIMNSKKFKKNFAFTACKNFRDRFSYLDLAKIVDWCLFILPNDLDELIGDYTEDLISCLIAQGIPSSCFITLSNSKEFKLKEEAKYFESITKIPLGEERIQCLSNLNDATKLMRHLAQNCKPTYVASKKSAICSKSINKKRGYFLIQNMFYSDITNELKLTGCMRGFGVDLNTSQYMHITEVGDFPIKDVQWLSPEESNRFSNGSSAVNVKKFEIDPATKVNEVNMGENDQDSNGETSDVNDDDEEDDESEEIDDIDDESEEVSDTGSVDSDNDPNDDKMSFATTAHSGFSVAQIQKFKQSRENSLFPDEVDYPYTEKAHEKFRKYRSLKGFKMAEWPLDENLPEIYNKIHILRKYRHDRNRLCRNINKLDRDSIDNFVKCGSKLEMVLSNVNGSAFDVIKKIISSNPDRHMVASNLFPFENRISILHLNERRLNSVDDTVVNELAQLTANVDSAIELGQEATSHYDNLDENYKLKPVEEPVESKETMLFQIGFRRFSSTPIYSEFTATSDQPGNKGKGKYCQFMEPKKNVVATTYGPVTFGPVPVLQFRLRQEDLGMGELGEPYISELVASGSLLSVDPSRPIIKRILLTGQIYKVHKRTVMVRYMFFNTEDIEHFKSVPLHTRSKKTGRIICTHGMRGYMRCHFDKPVTQDEIALMPLYKRVFPKYTIDNLYTHLPTAYQNQVEENAANEAMDTLF